jgi:hypothetical protein
MVLRCLSFQNTFLKKNGSKTPGIRQEQDGQSNYRGVFFHVFKAFMPDNQVILQKTF